MKKTWRNKSKAALVLHWCINLNFENTGGGGNIEMSGIEGLFFRSQKNFSTNEALPNDRRRECRVIYEITF